MKKVLDPRTRGRKTPGLHKIPTTLAAALACLVATTFQTNGGPIEGTTVAEGVLESPYHRGGWEIQEMAGAYWEFGVYNMQPSFDYALESFRVGYMVLNPMGRGLWHGNFELLLGPEGGEFFRGPADYLVGGTLFFRWNFVQAPRPKWTPYFQFGSGGVYHNARNVDTIHQSILASNVEAMLQAGIGMRYQLNERWGIDGEFSYRHISDADTSQHNLGLNSLGGQLGLSYFFY